jgi:hypothetical protein
MNREELIKTVTRITDIRAKLSELSALQKELKHLEALLDSVTGEPMVSASRGRASIEERVWEFLSANANSDWSADEVAAKLEIKVPTTRAAFSKLRASKRIIDPKRGRVQAAKMAADAETNEGEGEQQATSKAA